MIYAFLPIIAAILFGLGYAFSEKALQITSVVTYMLFNGIAGVFIALGLSKFKAEPFSFSFMSDKPSLFFVLVAVIAPALGWMLTVYAIKNISASYAAFAEVSYPLFTILFLFLFFGVRHFDWTLLLGGGLVIAGSFILVWGQLMAGK